MLGLARHSQYAGWGSVPLAPEIAATSSIAHENYLSDTYSRTNQQGVSFGMSMAGSDGNSGPDACEVNLTNYSSLTEFNDRRWTMAATIYLDWDPAGATPGDQIYTFFHQPRFFQSGYTDSNEFYGLNCFVQVQDGDFYITSRIETPDTTRRAYQPLSGSWSDYSRRWLTVIYSGSDSVGSFDNFSDINGSLPGGNDSVYTRSSIYDTETGELLQSLDLVVLNTTADPNGGWDWDFPEFSAYGNTLPIYTNNVPSGVTDYFYGPSPDVTARTIKVANVWGSFGTMFDPISELDTSIFTKFPAQQIGNAKAWYNLCMEDTVSITHYGSSHYFTKLHNQDLISQTDDAGIMIGSTLTDWDSTTIPKDRLL